MRLWYDNETYKCDLTASSEETGYPGTNILDIQVKKTARSTNVTAVQTWDFDAGSGNTIDCDSVAILGHNISAAASQIQFVMAATTSFAGATTSVLLTHSTGLMAVYFAADSARYARVLVADMSNADGYIEMGFVYVASHVQMTYGVGVDFPYQPIDSSTGEYSNTGQWFGDEGELLDLYNFHMPYVNNAFKKQMLTIFEEIKTVKPMIFDFNESAHSAIEPLYCRFNDNIAFNHIPACVGTDYDFHWNCDISIKEMK